MMDKKGMLETIINYYTDGNKAQFANKLGVSAQTISAWVARNTFDNELIYTKCSGINPEWLLTGTGDMLRSENVPEPKPREPLAPPLYKEEDANILDKLLQKIDEQGIKLQEKSKEIGRLEAKIENLEAKIEQLQEQLTERSTSFVKSVGCPDVRPLYGTK